MYNSNIEHPKNVNTSHQIAIMLFQINILYQIICILKLQMRNYEIGWAN
jgi:hypothetical protein